MAGTIAVAVKAAWCGSGLLLVVGPILLFAFAMTLTGFPPFIIELLVFISLTVPAGYRGFLHYGRSFSGVGIGLPRSGWMNVILPAIVLVMFSLLFVMANPDLLSFMGERVSLLMDTLRSWVVHYSPSPSEFVFWFCAAWIALGLMRPVFDRINVAVSESTANDERKPARTTFYPAFRNTLFAVNVLFTIYLIFEFKTLWLRVFPPGFYYSGYAHEGAAWLTVALALATVILSVVFSGDVLRDPRLPQLRYLAWLWSLQNLLLAVAVYHRLFIYVGFNGMSYMRVVGLFGMSAVVAGFLLVVWKIAYNRNFVWLFRRQLWALAITTFLFSVTPVQLFVVSYNVRRILNGDLAPSVQISVHPINSEGLLQLHPLLNASEPTIREGIRAMLAKQLDLQEQRAAEQRQLGWTAWQLSDQLLLEDLRSHQGQWSDYQDEVKRDAALKGFHKYAYQWY
jgi:hypothetical protein